MPSLQTVQYQCETACINLETVQNVSNSYFVLSSYCRFLSSLTNYIICRKQNFSRPFCGMRSELSLLISCTIYNLHWVLNGSRFYSLSVSNVDTYLDFVDKY